MDGGRRVRLYAFQQMGVIVGMVSSTQCNDITPFADAEVITIFELGVYLETMRSFLLVNGDLYQRFLPCCFTGV